MIPLITINQHDRLYMSTYHVRRGNVNIGITRLAQMIHTGLEKDINPRIEELLAYALTIVHDLYKRLERDHFLGGQHDDTRWLMA